MANDPRDSPEALLEFGEDTVVLVVGPEKKRLLMHRSHVQRSRFIQAPFKEVWAKGSRELELPEDEVDLIRLWLHFLYTGKIASRVSLDNQDHALHGWETMLHCRLYVLGEKFQDARCKNAVIDAIIAKSKEEDQLAGLTGLSPSGPDIDVLYRSTCKGSLARKLMVRMHLERGDGEWITDHKTQNREFLEDLCERMLEERDDDRRAGIHEPRRIRTAFYHEEVE